MNKLKQYIKKNKINQVELANNVGVSKGYLSLILNGKRNLSIDLAKKIQNVLGVDSSIFFD